MINTYGMCLTMDLIIFLNFRFIYIFLDFSLYLHACKGFYNLYACLPYPQQSSIYRCSCLEFASIQLFLQLQNQIFQWVLCFFSVVFTGKPQSQQTIDALPGCKAELVSSCFPKSIACLKFYARQGSAHFDTQFLSFLRELQQTLNPGFSHGVSFGFVWSVSILPFPQK